VSDRLQDAYMKDVEAIEERMKALLAGQHPALQGAVLANLIALFIAGHHESMRSEMLSLHVATVRDLIPLRAAEIWGLIREALARKLS
jgi:hypothetical protein